jgi:hypothetical protein
MAQEIKDRNEAEIRNTLEVITKFEESSSAKFTLTCDSISDAKKPKLSMII